MSEAGTEVLFDRHGGETPADLYRFDRVAEGVNGFDGVTDEHLAFYREYGYLVIHHAFTIAEITSVLEGVLDLVDGKNPDFKGVQFEAAARPILASLKRDEKPAYVRKLMHFVQYDPRCEAMAAHPGLLKLLQRLFGRPAELFTDQAFLKPARVGREKPWHQDHAYFKVPLGTPVTGAWIAIDPATAENGCLHVIPGSHREGPAIHFQRRDWQLCDADVRLAGDTMVVMETGGLLLWDGLLHHGSPPNTSDKPRRSLQFHYVPQGTPRTTEEERLAVFGSEGKDVTC